VHTRTEENFEETEDLFTIFETSKDEGDTAHVTERAGDIEEVVGKK
jgi:hypothetical protein